MKIRYDAPTQKRSALINGITETIQRALASAGLTAQSAATSGLTDIIQRGMLAAQPNSSADRSQANSILDANAGAVLRLASINGNPTARERVADAPVSPGTFESRSFANDAGALTYKLYIPASYSGEPAPMVVMLHGCTQSPDDFAAGTRMNELAERHGFLVVYPAQKANANASKCWNWFQLKHQCRDRGEPAIIAGITREVINNLCVDERRIFVAGLSAGAAMAVILGATYPELYAAVGAHSGLTSGVAHDVPSAFAAMKRTEARLNPMRVHGAIAAPRFKPTRAMPTIVFHGDMDHTVNVQNGVEIINHAIAQPLAGCSDTPPLRQCELEQGLAGGRSYKRTIYVDANGQSRAEQWLVQGAGHAWSGGSQAGSFTDSRGPDASAEMIRFFFGQERESMD